MDPEKAQSAMRRRDDQKYLPQNLDQVAINIRSRRLLDTLLDENPTLATILRNSRNEVEASVGLKEYILEHLRDRPEQTVRGIVELKGAPQSILARVWRRVSNVLIRESGF